MFPSTLSSTITILHALNCLLIHLYTILSYSILLYYSNGVTLIVNKTVENSVLGCNQSEVSQKEKHQYSILMHIYGI